MPSAFSTKFLFGVAISGSNALKSEVAIPAAANPVSIRRFLRGLQATDSVEIRRDYVDGIPRRNLEAVWSRVVSTPRARATPLNIARPFIRRLNEQGGLVVAVDESIHNLSPFHQNYRHPRDDSVTTPLQLIAVAQPLQHGPEPDSLQLVGTVRVRRYLSSELGADAVVVPVGARMAQLDSREQVRDRLMFLSTPMACVFWGVCIIVIALCKLSLFP